MKLIKIIIVLIFTLLTKSTYPFITQHNIFTDSLRYAITISKTEPDVAIELLDEWHSDGAERKDTNKMIRCLLTSSQIQEAQLKYGNAIELTSQALFISEIYQDSLLMAKAYSSFGRLLHIFNQQEASGFYLKQACEIYKQQFTFGEMKSQELLSAYFNLAKYMQWIADYETALTYLDTCYSISDTMNQDAVERAYLDGEKGQIRLLRKDYDEAIQILIASSLVFEDLQDTEADRDYLIILYSNLGDAYRQIKELDLALFFYEKAIKASSTNQQYLKLKPSILEHYAEILFEQGWYVEAYENLQEAKTLQQRYFSPENLLSNNFITLNNTYRRDLIDKTNALNTRNQVLNKQTKQNIFLKLSLLILIIVIIAFIAYTAYHSNQEKQKRKYALLVEKQDKTQKQSEINNKELVRSTLEQLKQNEILTQLSTELKQGTSQKNKEPLLQLLNQHNHDTWEKFNTQFSEINRGFYERLASKLPELSPADQKICALIKLNFSGKEMAQLLGISIGSVHMASHRLRKKLNMKRDENLSDVISAV